MKKKSVKSVKYYLALNHNNRCVILLYYYYVQDLTIRRNKGRWKLLKEKRDQSDDDK